MTIPIIGAGMAGLLAARMLRHRDPVVIEAQDQLPNNHSAVLRFRSPLVGEVLGIPFKRVRVLKGVVPWENPVADALAYSKKCTGTYLSDRSITAETGMVERWIAPPDLIERMAEGVNIKFGHQYGFPVGNPKAISTIPMSALMKLLDYPEYKDVTFKSVIGINLRATIRECDAYVSIAVPDPDLPFSRVSITGNELIIECQGGFIDDRAYILDKALRLLGLPHYVSDVEERPQPYSKIIPIDEEARRNFIYWSSSLKQRAFSLGRFATWRPGLLLDDLVNDVRFIERLMQSKSHQYDAEQSETRRD
jgi:hypothetical protein